MNKKQFLLITMLLSGAQTQTFMGAARTAVQRFVMSTKGKGVEFITKGRNAGKEFSEKLSQRIHNASDSAKQSVKNVPRIAGLALWGKAKEDPYAVVGAGVGAGTGAVLSGEGPVKTSTGFFGGAILGYHMAKTRQRLVDVQKRVKDVQTRMATKTHVDRHVEILGGKLDAVRTNVRQGFDRLTGKIDKAEEGLTDAIKKGQEDLSSQVKSAEATLSDAMRKQGKTLQTQTAKLDELIAGQKSGFKQVGDLWNKWFPKKS